MIYCTPSHNGCVKKIQGGLLKRAVNSRERLTPEQRWEQLIAELDAMAITPRPDEYRILHLIAKIEGLGMVQSFSWMQWQVPYPEPEQTRMLDLETAVKHITRICRAERFFENSIVGHIHSGFLMGLCLVVREHTQRQHVPKVVKKPKSFHLGR